MNASSAAVVAVPNLIAFWDFHEPAGSPRVAQGRAPYALTEMAGPIPRADEGVFGPHAARFGQGWLAVPRAQCGALDLHGPAAQVTVVAWIKRARPADGSNSCEAVAGIWNEHGLRQYCLFLNLGIWGSAQQVGAHITAVGGATPGHKYCMDAALGATPVPFGAWQCVAISYDGAYARAYLNGQLDVRPFRNPYYYPLGLFDGGPQGADFTVGAVARPEYVDDQRRAHGSVVANCFHGLLGGLAVYDRALADTELQQLAALLPPRPAVRYGHGRD